MEAKRILMFIATAILLATSCKERDSNTTGASSGADKPATVPQPASGSGSALPETSSNQLEGTRFEVYERAESPEGAWFGDLYNDRDRPGSFDYAKVIVVFPKDLKLARDDKLKGVFISTVETGLWNRTPYRIYELKGKYEFVGPLTKK